MQALIHNDKTIIEAHEKAVAAAVREAEKLGAGPDDSPGNQNSLEPPITTSIKFATFRHETSGS